ncbi:hypothetical protein M378DRAFT_458895 [Amanita muscaria Koide BX008]|uniref:Uncharacterized protein n=1 Tax=Amanita muscaria (strain Koide BX008) TaxID=946122 RepID=A0A0C2SR17_AMAMK|nr:hypothetical protein M378DRAFT_458895 [Amanita muscaria Koide BX008]
MCGTYDQRYRYPYQVDTFSVPRSYFSSASDDSDLESPVGGGGGSSADSAGSGSSQSTPQQSQNQEFTHQHSQQDSPPRQSLPQVPTLSIRRVSLPSVDQLNAALSKAPLLRSVATIETAAKLTHSNILTILAHAFPSQVAIASQSSSRYLR